MVLKTAALQSRSMYFSRKGFGSVITFTAERRYRNVLVRNMRFSNLLFSNISNLHFRSKHKFAEKLVQEVDYNRKKDILGRSKVLNKVSAWLCYDGLDDSLDNGKAIQESFDCPTNENEDLGISLACKQFPSINLGDSPTVTLYDGDTYSSWDESLLVEHLCTDLLSRATGTNWDDEDGLYKSLGSLYPKLAKGSSAILDQVAPDSSSRSSPSLNMKEASRLESQSIADELKINPELAKRTSTILDQVASGSSSRSSPSLNMKESSRLESQPIADKLKVYPKLAKGNSTILDQVASDSSSRSSPSLNMKEASRLESQSIADELKVYPKLSKGSSTILDQVACDSSSRSSPSLNMKESSRLESQAIAEESKVYPKLEKGSCTMFEQVASDSTSMVSPSLNMEEASRLESQFIADEPFNVESPVEAQESATSIMPVLDTTINCIHGVGKRMSQQLESCGFHTLRKLLHHFPRTYVDMQNAHSGICDGQYVFFVGEILSCRGFKASPSISFLDLVVACEVAKEEPRAYTFDDVDNRKKKTIYLNLKQFFRGPRFTLPSFLKGIEGNYNKGDVVSVSGKVRATRVEDRYEMREYHIENLCDEEDSSTCAEEKLYPIHPSKGALRASVLRDLISRALKMLPVNLDPIPRDITQELGLPCLRDAYVGIHQPKNFEEANLARKRLIFDEFFYLQLGRLFQMLEGLGTQIERDGLLDKYRKPKMNATCKEEWSSLTKSLLDTLPYALTPSQLNAVSEIIWDLKRPVPMNRLLQGDVGCGKTVVAFLACMEVIGHGYQAAFMVPTELLAKQHYEHCLKLLEKVEVEGKPSVALLTGSTSLKESRSIRKGLETGEISLVIGTQTLIGKVKFAALRIAIVDEQQRFGVIQRGLFNSKLNNPSIMPKEDLINSDDSKDTLQMAPHVLAMSATPIPRTLALALYGDISLTQITDLPPGRFPVQTFSIEGTAAGFEKVYQMMLDELGTGGKVYLVYHAIELSGRQPQLRGASTEFETISRRFPGYSCGLLHGKMKSEEKDDALKRFRSGEIDILLATQVIEIGVDVPDASMMVVMNAERFGLAQLHQLRGRVGRGERKSKCLLVSSTAAGLNRLKLLKNSSDGFHIANMDLAYRGPGDLLGEKQSGHLPEFPIARLEDDGSIIQDAHLATLKILERSHDLQKFNGLRLELNMRHPLCVFGD